MNEDGTKFSKRKVKLKDVVKIPIMVVDVNSQLKLKRKDLQLYMRNGLIKIHPIKAQKHILSNLHLKWLSRFLRELVMKM